MFNEFFKPKHHHESRYLGPKVRPILLVVLLLVVGVLSLGDTWPTPIVHAQSSSDYGPCYTKRSKDASYVYYRQTTRDNCVWQAYYNSTYAWRYGKWSIGNNGYTTYFSVKSTGQVYRWSGTTWNYWYKLF